jgi:hypothetical protein
MYTNGGNANTALEACMCGSILLHSNLKLTSDVIFEDGVNALLADNNVYSITEKLVFALDHPELKDDYYEVSRRELFPYTNDYLTPLLCRYYDDLFKKSIIVRRKERRGTPAAIHSNFNDDRKITADPKI